VKILIVENEIYLAQSIASKLTEHGYVCETATTIKEALKDEHFDAILLSTNVSGQNFYPVIERYKSSIIILMISYVSNDTVSNPLKAGANDYILKPFMMEELIRKLNHLKDYNILQKENETYKNYITHLFKGLQNQNLPKKINFPLFIKTNYQKNADALVYRYSQEAGEPFSFVSLCDSGAIDKISKTKANELIYLVDFQNIKRNEKNIVIDIVKDKRAIISSTESCEDHDFYTIELQSENRVFDRGEVLSIDDYVKYIILNFQNKFPDTELSKKLGISRKSLWEKRKKYGITKKK
jgi:DNA-binding NtrC family response regulator